MYLPAVFAEHDPAILLPFMRAHPFATLVTVADGRPLAGHLPLLVERDPQGGVLLRGHLARANPQALATDTALAVFHGPHAYISAAWYDADDTVPTWNYQVVQARGTLTISDDPQEIDAVLDRLAEELEGTEARRWQQRLGAATRDRLGRQIVAVTLTVDHLAGKWKLGQQQPAGRRARVIAALRDLGGEDDRAIAAAMEGTLATGNGVRT